MLDRRPAAWLAEHYGFPIILLGLLIGLALNFVAREPATHPGLDFASRTCLRWGIVALGFQITLVQVWELGPWPFAALAGIMAVTFGAGLLGARISGQSRYAGILAGGATAICGASAALALYGIIGRDRLNQAQFALTLVGVSLASAFAMSLYPVVAGQLGLSDTEAGFLIGASIHDVAQAIGGGFTFSDAAGAEATIIKLTRVALLGPVLILVALWIGTEGGGAGRPAWRRITLPWFIVGFLLLLALRSFGAIPEVALKPAQAVANGLTIMSMAALGLGVDVRSVLRAGKQVTSVVVLSLLVLAAISYVLILLLGIV